MQSNPFAEIALDGSLLLAAPIAVLAGLISFLSPCVLPLVPGYLGYVTGLGGDVLTSRRRGRLVLRGIPVIAAAVAATLAAAFFLGVLLSPAAVSADTAGPATQSVTVMPGDSLWTIATTVAPEADVYEVIATIDELNGLEGRAPAPGEELFVPATR